MRKILAALEKLYFLQNRFPYASKTGRKKYSVYLDLT